MKYKQCLLCRDGKYRMSWLPIVFAVKNKVLKLRDKEWTDGWLVKAVYDGAMPHEQVKEIQKLSNRMLREKDIEESNGRS